MAAYLIQCIIVGDIRNYLQAKPNGYTTFTNIIKYCKWNVYVRSYVIHSVKLCNKRTVKLIA